MLKPLICFIKNIYFYNIKTTYLNINECKCVHLYIYTYIKRLVGRYNPKHSSVSYMLYFKIRYRCCKIKWNHDHPELIFNRILEFTYNSTGVEL